MKLFGRELSTKKRVQGEVHEFVERNGDIIDYFAETVRRRGIEDGLVGAFMSSAVTCVVSRSLQLKKDMVMAALPVSLCLVRKMGERPLGIVRPASLANIEVFLRRICGATEVSTGGFGCLSLRIAGQDYPFFLMPDDRVVDIDLVPGDVMVIASDTAARRAGFDRHQMVVREEEA